MPEVSGALATQVGSGFNWTDIVIPIFCVFLTWWLTMRHERKKEKASAADELLKKISELEDRLKIYEDVERAVNGDYYTLKGTGETICPVCWGAEHKPIPVRDNGTGKYKCALCGTHGIYSRRDVERQKAEQSAFAQEILNSNFQNQQLPPWL